MSKQPRWKWKNGRLHSPTDPNLSLSIDEAFVQQTKYHAIAEACHCVLIPYSPNAIKNSNFTIESLRREQKARIDL